MTLESLKKLAQDAIDTAKQRVEKAASSFGSGTDGAVGGGPVSLDGVAKVLGQKATEAVEALREAKFVKPIVEGATTVVDTANRVTRAAHAARDAFVAEPPVKGVSTPPAQDGTL
jgi:ElaB/YqjD/DUF883 family membrane-anchored ribosome-binding protein